LIGDNDFAAWISGESDEVRELIVEAQMPERRVVYEQETDGRVLPKRIGRKAPAHRLAVLEELNSFLNERLGLETNLLKAAGAIVVRADSQQARYILEHRLVKAIKPNRRLY